MTIRDRISKRFNSDETTGFGTLGGSNSGRFYNKGGTPNVKKVGLGFSEYFSWYHTLLGLPNYIFLLLILLGYILLNIVFTLIYALIGIEHLIGIEQKDAFHDFMEIFFFSTQTFTTVGYGRVSPSGMLTSGVATFEAFLGLLSFALATGLFFARFSKPTSHIKFSKNALIAPFKEGKALMFRMAPEKNVLLSEVEVKITLAMKITENGVLMNKFYNLDTQISKITLLALSWTVVHPIDVKSPLFDITEEELHTNFMEVLVFVKGFDEAYSNYVMARMSYVNNEIIHNAKFEMMYYPDEKARQTILDFEKLDDFIRI